MSISRSAATPKGYGKGRKRVMKPSSRMSRFSRKSQIFGLESGDASARSVALETTVGRRVENGPTPDGSCNRSLFGQAYDELISIT